MGRSILITEDDRVQREIINDILTQSGYDVAVSDSAETTLEILKERGFDLIVTDMRMPGMDGLELLRQAKRLRPEQEMVVMTAHATIRTAVTAMKEGAIDYLEKPFDKDELLVVVDRALERTTLRKENRQLRTLAGDTLSLRNIIGDSPAMQAVFERTARAARVNSTVLILGESGTGKELIARHIHFEGNRQKKPFVVVNCAAIPDNLVESELFGHEKGSFTGADASRPGKFEDADTGTLFLDEIGDMQLESQAKLLRVLQDGVVERVGSSKTRQVDVRVIAATNRDLRERVDRGEFREDLYFRLEVLPVNLPPLRERIEDLPHLIKHFQKKLGPKIGVEAPQVGPDVLDAFRRYRWPGNVRELEHTLEQLFILSNDNVIAAKDLPQKFHAQPELLGEVGLPAGGLSLEELEQDLIRQALDRSGGRIKEAAELLGLTYKTLQYRLKKHEIDRKSNEN